MNYKARRTAAGLSVYTMAKETGLDKKKYLEVEAGRLHLFGDFLDKFMSAIDRAKELNFNRLVKMKEVNEWLESGQAKEDMKNLGYEQIPLAEALGVHNSYVSHALVANGKYTVSDDFKEELYDFLKNPLNKNTEPKPERKKRTKKEVEVPVIIEPVVQEEPKIVENEVSVDVEAQNKKIEELERTIEELEKTIKTLEFDNKYLKVSLKRIFNI